MRRLTTVAEEQDEERDLDGIRERIALLDEELVLYHPSGSWRFMADRLAGIEERAMNQLVEGRYEEVPVARATIKTVRYLASTPDRLREERARLQEILDESVQ